MERITNITKALADGNRVRVIMVLTDYDELCVCEITEMLALAAATVSRHMSVLQNAGLVKSRKEGRWVYYRLSDTFSQRLLHWLLDVARHANQIARDRENLKTIISGGHNPLCKTQRKRREQPAASLAIGEK